MWASTVSNNSSRVVTEKCICLTTLYSDDIRGALCIQQLMHSHKRCIAIDLLDLGDMNDRIQYGQYEVS